MQENIPQQEVDKIVNIIKTEMKKNPTFPIETIEGVRIEVIHPENWEVSLLVPSVGKIKSGEMRRAIEKIIFGVCGIDRMCCDYFGKQQTKKAYEWYFRHPNTPENICERLEAEIEKELGNEIGIGLPTPRGCKSKTDIVFMTLKVEYFREIEVGNKKIEYRNLNQYYCDKLLSPGVEKKYIKFNRGYASGEENQMVFEIKEIQLVNDKGETFPARNEKGEVITSYKDLPKRFEPSMYGIVLGKRVG